MSARDVMWISLTIGGVAFYAVAHRTTRRIRRVRKELRRLRYNRMLAAAYELEQQADESVWGVG